MKYLFFDTECCNGTDICSFGYVICNENFEILEREDIIINPRAHFQLGHYRAQPEIELAYDKATFLAAPDFRKFYTRISNLLTSSPVLGHAINCDARVIMKACTRYNLPLIKFDFFDTQVAYKLFSGEENCAALEKIAEKLNLELDCLHRSDDDALTSMKIAAEICKRRNITLDELLQEPTCVGSVDKLLEADHAKQLKRELYELRRRKKIDAESDSAPRAVSEKQTEGSKAPANKRRRRRKKSKPSPLTNNSESS